MSTEIEHWEEFGKITTPIFQMDWGEKPRITRHDNPTEPEGRYVAQFSQRIDGKWFYRKVDRWEFRYGPNPWQPVPEFYIFKRYSEDIWELINQLTGEMQALERSMGNARLPNVERGRRDD